MHWEPKAFAICVMRSGSLIAAVFTATLSAPDCSEARASSTDRIPPPTVRGMKMSSLAWRMIGRSERRS